MGFIIFIQLRFSAICDGADSRVAGDLWHYVLVFLLLQELCKSEGLDDGLGNSRDSGLLVEKKSNWNLKIHP